MPKKDLAEGFAQQAERNIQAARILLKSDYSEWAFFLTHHSVELSIKAILTALGWTAELLKSSQMSHDLERLGRQFPDETRVWLDQFGLDLPGMLVVFRAEPRYPKQTETSYVLGHTQIDNERLSGWIESVERLVEGTQQILPLVSDQLRSVFSRNDLGTENKPE